MIRVWAVMFALAVVYAGSLLVMAAFAKATNQLERNVSARTDDFEATARIWGDRAGGGAVVRHNQNSSRFLPSGSEGSL